MRIGPPCEVEFDFKETAIVLVKRECAWAIGSSRVCALGVAGAVRAPELDVREIPGVRMLRIARDQRIGKIGRCW